MLLYDKKEKTIDIYEFSADANDLFNYRKQQMEKIPKEEIFYIATAYPRDKDDKPILEKQGNSFNSKIIPMWYLNSSQHFHFFNTDDKISEGQKQLLLDRLNNGEFDKNKIARVKDDKLRYFLLKSTEYHKDMLSASFDKRVLENIIEVPESLYYLQLILQEKFSFLDNVDISEQLSLFGLNYVDKFNINELEKIDKLNVVPGAFDRVINKAARDSVIIKKYNKSKK